MAGPGAVSGDPGVGGVEAGADPAPPHLHPVHHAPLLLRQDLRQDVLNIEGTQLVRTTDYCDKCTIFGKDVRLFVRLRHIALSSLLTGINDYPGSKKTL